MVSTESKPELKASHQYDASVFLPPPRSRSPALGVNRPAAANTPPWAALIIMTAAWR